MTSSVVKGPVLSKGRLAARAGRLLALICFSAAFFSAAGVLDTDMAATLPRIGYWSMMSATSTLVLENCHRWLDRRVQRQQWQLRAAGVLISFLPLTGAALLLCKAFFGGPLSADRFLAVAPGMAGVTAALQFILAIRVSAVSSRGNEGHSEALGGEPGELVRRLPIPARRADIHAMRAEDHFVRIYTSAGVALVRMRFRDAIESLASQPGIRPHRSWWVAEAAVQAMHRTGRKTFLTVTGGLQVPVSRKLAAGLGPLFRRETSTP